MKTNELRIGNIVETWDSDYPRGENNMFINRIIGIGQKTVVFSDSSHAGYLEIEGIRITDEWLIKLGFEKKDTVFSKIWIRKDSSSYYDSGELCRSTGLDEDAVFSVSVQYVHELQNAWFVFESEELEVSL